MLKKIQDKIERVMENTGAMCTEIVNVVVRLTDEEVDCFLYDSDYRTSNYEWDLQENGMLYLSYVEIDMKKTRYHIIETNGGNVIFVQYTNKRRNKVCYMYDFCDNYCDALKAIEAIEVGNEFPYTNWDNNELNRIADFDELFPASDQFIGWDFVFDNIIGWLFYSRCIEHSKFYRWWKSRDR